MLGIFFFVTSRASASGGARYWDSVVLVVVVVACVYCVKRVSLGDERMCAFRFISFSKHEKKNNIKPHSN